MTIVGVETYLCHCYRANWVFVRLVGDDGSHGVGEATLEMREPTVAAAVHELERHLLGRDPFDLEGLWHECYRDSYWRGGPVLMTALAGVEMALWDLKGKALGVPVWQLLGGRCRDRVRCYANGWFAPARTPDEFAEKARSAVAQGFSGLKWDPFGKAYRTLEKAELRQALACLGAVVDAVGTDVDILVEGHGRFDLPTAIRLADALAEFDVTWFEEPLMPDHPEGMAELCRRSRVPIAGGERLYSRWDARTYLELGCADILQPDVSHVGGLGELKKIAAMAETYSRPVCPHNPIGPVANAATLHLAACVPNFWLLETMNTDVPWRREVTTERVRFVDGAMLIPDGPGLGLDLNLEAIAQHPYERRNLRHYTGELTAIRPPDAVEWYTSEVS